MPRNLDVTTLRSFVAVAQSGGVTRAAGFLNLTQSAVSMQLKRLEDLLGVSLLDRRNRTVALTPAGEQFLVYARRMVDLNDEAFAKLTDQIYEGEIVLGVPHDIVYPVVPQVLKRFNAEFPRMKVNLIASHTDGLKAKFARGECDLILTTEYGLDKGGETLTTIPLRWIGAPEGKIHTQQPLRLAFGKHCKFRPVTLAVLNKAGLDWEMAVETDSDRTIEATISADLAIGAMLEGTEPPQLALIAPGSGLPDLGIQKINMYGAEDLTGAVNSRLAAMVRQGYEALVSRPSVRMAG
ncbi:MAG TPA: LysR family transcriptional regulator [Aliiroseovarius sp.]|nr:LysR family transcriptional regulator [Aliiroseovarius sp.]